MHTESISECKRYLCRYETNVDITKSSPPSMKYWWHRNINDECLR